MADLLGEAVFICKDRMRLNRTLFDHNYTLTPGLRTRFEPPFGREKSREPSEIGAK